jgi:hypothetical protein
VSDRNPESETEFLTESATKRLLARASELDAARGAGVTIAALRTAATEAGISQSAFNAALAELKTAGEVRTHRDPAPKRSWRMMPAVVAAAAVLAVASLFAARTVARGPARVQLAEEAIQLRCLSLGDAAELVRPVMGTTGSVLISPTAAPHVITVRGNKRQLQTVKSMLDKAEAGASCPVTPPPTTTR